MRLELSKIGEMSKDIKTNRFYSQNVPNFRIMKANIKQLRKELGDLSGIVKNLESEAIGKGDQLIPKKKTKKNGNGKKKDDIEIVPIEPIIEHVQTKKEQTLESKTLKELNKLQKDIKKYSKKTNL